jgi:septin 6/8/11
LKKTHSTEKTKLDSKKQQLEDEINIFQKRKAAVAAQMAASTSTLSGKKKK